jgi:hypothetical protein
MSETQADTVPPPSGDDDAYSAETRVGAMPGELLEALRAMKEETARLQARSETAAPPEPLSGVESPSPEEPAPEEPGPEEPLHEEPLHEEPLHEEPGPEEPLHVDGAPPSVEPHSAQAHATEPRSMEAHSGKAASPSVEALQAGLGLESRAQPVEDLVARDRVEEARPTMGLAPDVPDGRQSWVDRGTTVVALLLTFVVFAVGVVWWLR